jgi:hypothetical protein
MVDRNDPSMDFSVPRYAVGVPGEIKEASGICENSFDLSTYDFVVNGLSRFSLLGSRAAGDRNT